MEYQPKETANGGEGNPGQKHATTKLNAFRPFRHFQYRTRRIQREQAKYDEHKRYRETQESALAKLLYYADWFWRWAWTRRTSVWMVWFTFFLTILAGISGYEMWYQNRIMIRQMGQTNRQIELTRGQLDAMTEQNKASIEQTKLARNQLLLATKAIEQTQTTIDRTSLDSRAWVAPAFPRLVNDSGEVRELKGKEAMRAIVTLQNAGKTPAYIMGNVADLDIYDDDAKVPDRIKAALITAVTEGRENALAAGNGINGNCQPRIFLDDEVEAINRGKKMLFLVGVVLYRDVYGAIQQLHYVFVWNRDRKQLELHTKYQYMK